MPRLHDLCQNLGLPVDWRKLEGRRGKILVAGWPSDYPDLVGRITLLHERNIRYLFRRVNWRLVPNFIGLVTGELLALLYRQLSRSPGWPHTATYKGYTGFPSGSWR
jgi:hypothetical protein